MMIKHFVSFTVVFFVFITAHSAPNCPKLGVLECSCPNHPNYCITAGSKQFTYYKVASDLADIVAPDARMQMPKSGIALEVVEGGSIDNIKKMRWQHGVKFAIVQSDVLEFYRAAERGGDRDAGNLLRPLRVILPLYNEEVHLVTRAGSSIRTFSDLYQKRIALGKEGGGSAMTGLAMYSYMFGESIPKQNQVYSGFNDALRMLINNQVDAWFMVVGQPTSKFTEMKDGASDLIRFVEFDRNNSTEQEILNGPYFEATIHASSYSWLERDVPTLTVKAFLISQVYQNPSTRANVRRFTESLCRNFDKLQASGHKKWQEVRLEKATLPGGWLYSDDALKAFSGPSCNLGGATGALGCSEAERILDICPE